MASLTVLLIDDDKFMRRFLTLAFAKAGYGILEAEEATSGFDLLEKKNPDFVVCDQVMPGMSGTDFYKKMRATDRFKETPFLILSGEDVTLPSDPYARVLKKPVMPSQILEFVARWSPKKQEAS